MIAHGHLATHGGLLSSVHVPERGEPRSAAPGRSLHRRRGRRRWPRPFAAARDGTDNHCHDGRAARETPSTRSDPGARRGRAGRMRRYRRRSRRRVHRRIERRRARARCSSSALPGRIRARWRRVQRVRGAAVRRGAGGGRAASAGVHRLLLRPERLLPGDHRRRRRPGHRVHDVHRGAEAGGARRAASARWRAQSARRLVRAQRLARSRQRGRVPPHAGGAGRPRGARGAPSRCRAGTERRGTSRPLDGPPRQALRRGAISTSTAGASAGAVARDHRTRERRRGVRPRDVRGPDGHVAGRIGARPRRGDGPGPDRPRRGASRRLGVAGRAMGRAPARAGRAPACPRGRSRGDRRTAPGARARPADGAARGGRNATSRLCLRAARRARRVAVDQRWPPPSPIVV